MFRWLYRGLRDLLRERRYRDIHPRPERVRNGGATDPVYSGIYPTYGAALEAAPKGAFVGFDHPVIPDFYLDHHFGLNPYDYPVLFWLGKLYPSTAAVFDFGGGIGQCRYAYGPYLQSLRDADGAEADRPARAPEWIVYDLPAFVERGERLAKEKGIPDLRFTTDVRAAARASTFLTNGCLQYLREDLADVLADLEALPHDVLINRVPLRDGPEYYTIQRTRHCTYTPYRVMDRDALCRRMRALGYRLVDCWEVPRGLEVNFQPAFDVPKYGGLYFRQEARQSARLRPPLAS